MAVKLTFLQDPEIRGVGYNLAFSVPDDLR